MRGAKLLRDAVEAVAGVAEARHDVAVFVELFIERAEHDSHILARNVGFNGGKALGSKVKFSTFYLIIDIQGKDDHIDANEVYFKVTANIKKAIAAHKLGEAGFKANVTGSYYNAFDSVNDSFKLLEDAINQS